eukprot:7225783-Prymnesium_polylepis.1
MRSKRKSKQKNGPDAAIEHTPGARPEKRDASESAYNPCSEDASGALNLSPSTVLLWPSAL